MGKDGVYVNRLHFKKRRNRLVFPHAINDTLYDDYQEQFGVTKDLDLEVGVVSNMLLESAPNAACPVVELLASAPTTAATCGAQDCRGPTDRRT